MGQRYNRKSNKERKSGVLQFRLNVGERKHLERACKEMGLSFSEMFRLRVLGESALMPESYKKISAAIDEAAKQKPGDEGPLEQIVSALIRREAARKRAERETVKRYRERRSA